MSKIGNRTSVEHLNVENIVSSALQMKKKCRYLVQLIQSLFCDDYTSSPLTVCTSNIPLPDPTNTGTEPFTISAKETLLTLATELSYEVAQSYNLVFRVVDTTAGHTRSLVVKVTFIVYLFLLIEVKGTFVLYTFLHQSCVIYSFYQNNLPYYEESFGWS